MLLFRSSIATSNDDRWSVDIGGELSTDPRLMSGVWTNFDLIRARDRGHARAISLPIS